MLRHVIRFMTGSIIIVLILLLMVINPEIFTMCCIVMPLMTVGCAIGQIIHIQKL